MIHWLCSSTQQQTISPRENILIGALRDFLFLSLPAKMMLKSLELTKWPRATTYLPHSTVCVLSFSHISEPLKGE